MNTDVMKGSINDFDGQTKERIGAASGDGDMQASGIADQIAGTAQKAYGSASEAVAPTVEKARSFAKTRPYATAALVGVVGIALLNTLRGR